MKRQKGHILIAALITLAVPLIGYLSFGIVPAALFFVGYFSGFILWLLVPNTAPFASIKWIYWITFLLFVVHRIEEKVSGFFDTLAEMTGIAKPEIVSVPIILLLITSVGAWILGPVMASKRHPIGIYLVWTFFASMGVTELAHFVLPFFRNEAYGYFPGMASVFVLAPVAWYGMIKFKNHQV
jgi:hypothetical protein